VYVAQYNLPGNIDISTLVATVPIFLVVITLELLWEDIQD
jgi:hypothetical protein